MVYIANQRKSKEIKANQMNPIIGKPVQKSTSPKPIPGNNQYPGELSEVVFSADKRIFVPVGTYPGYKIVDHCLVIDTNLGIFARERACDTIFLQRDPSYPGLVFIEY